jgi:hypothetical protein
LTLEIQTTIKRESIWMDHKNPVSDTGDGVLYLDIMKKHAICFDYRFGKVHEGSISIKFYDDLLDITTLT